MLLSVHFDWVVRRQRIQLRAMWWELVRRLFTSTDSCSQPISNTSSPSPHASSSSPSSVLLPGMHRQLRFRWMVWLQRDELQSMRR